MVLNIIQRYMIILGFFNCSISYVGFLLLWRSARTTATLIIGAGLHFRDLVNYCHGRKRAGMQADMVVERKPRVLHPDWQAAKSDSVSLVLTWDSETSKSTSQWHTSLTHFSRKKNSMRIIFIQWHRASQIFKLTWKERFKPSWIISLDNRKIFSHLFYVYEEVLFTKWIKMNLNKNNGRLKMILGSTGFTSYWL